MWLNVKSEISYLPRPKFAVSLLRGGVFLFQIFHCSPLTLPLEYLLFYLRDELYVKNHRLMPFEALQRPDRVIEFFYHLKSSEWRAVACFLNCDCFRKAWHWCPWLGVREDSQVVTSPFFSYNQVARFEFQLY